ncbi:PTS sugar transporter subunit IIA [Oceanivirga salmonicida]|uniref:PTS sugar transporter subunit IIA n=1 Tax=Oceanivirga salmonicida TaxID=1769291 RepID=UPI00083591EF|nr:PTS sugar transporter subunit IIA [Oceanivirga salmonicida]
MQISDYLKLEAINLKLGSKDKKSILKELFSGLANCNEVNDAKKCYDDLLERENLGSTGIGKGVAIPHAKTSGVDKIIMTIGISENPIEYNSIDNKEVKLFFMFLAPTNLSQEYLILLAKISRFIKEEKFREKLLNAKTKDEIGEILRLKES